ncbi:sensor domain-containing diguanylate cyclase [Neiella marina]|nr:diguanylate cyclase [Neiella marina]
MSREGWSIHVAYSRAISLHREISRHIETLRTLAAIYETQPNVSWEQFQQVSTPILESYVHTQALQWLPKVAHSERKLYEQAMKKRFPEFRFTHQQNNKMVNAAKREVYYPIYYLNPLKGNNEALGYDVASSSVRRAGLMEAASSGTPQLIAGLKLVQQKDDAPLFFAVVPIYKQPSSTPQERLHNLKGFVLGVFKLRELFDASALSKRPLGIKMTLIDESDPSQQRVLYVHESRTSTPIVEGTEIRQPMPHFWGKTWSILATPTTSFMNHHSSFSTWVIALVGGGSSFLLAFFTRSILSRVNQIQALNRQLKTLAQEDGLTGLANRRRFDEVLSMELSRSHRQKTSLSLALIDIDYFKQYNDVYGHMQGDHCLQSFAECLRKAIRRPTDLAVRYGGEEFALLLPDTGSPEGVILTLQQLLKRAGIPHEASNVASFLTASIGVVTVTSGIASVSPSELIEHADQALYRAKNAGRNTVEYIRISHEKEEGTRALLRAIS